MTGHARVRERLYRAVYLPAQWPMTVFGWVAPKTGARIATWWMHYCGYAVDAHVEAVNRRQYRIVVDKRPRRKVVPEVSS